MFGLFCVRLKKQRGVSESESDNYVANTQTDHLRNRERVRTGPASGTRARRLSLVYLLIGLKFSMYL